MTSAEAHEERSYPLDEAHASDARIAEPWWRTAVLVLAALGLWGLVWHKALAHLGTRFIGAEGVDHYGTQWYYWFVDHQLRQGKGPGYTDLFFFPYGKDIYLHTGSNFIDAYLALPLRWVFGPVLGYNLFVLAGLVFTGWAFYWLASQFSRDRWANLGATVLFLSSPFILLELEGGRPTQAIIGGVALFLGFMWRAGRRPGWRAPVVAGVLLAILGYQYWFYAFFAGMACLAHGLWRLAFPPEGAGGRGPILARHVLIALVALILCTPGALPMLRKLEASDGSVPGLLDTRLWSLSFTPTVTAEGTDVALQCWQPFRLDTGAYWSALDGRERFMPYQETTSWVLIVLVGLYLLRPRALDRGAFLAVVLCAGFLAMGPFILFGDTSVANPVYIYLAKSLMFFRRLWWPGRAYVILSVLFALSAALVLSWLEALGRPLQSAALLLIAGFWGWHLVRGELAPLPVWDAEVPAGYSCLSEGGKGALIELPYGWSQAHLYYQTVHHRPILGGMIENNPVFTPSESVALRTKNTFVHALLAAARQQTPDKEPTPEDREAVYKLGYRYVVLQKDAYWVPEKSASLLDNARRTLRRRVANRLEELIGPPIFDDERVAIYAPWGDPLPCDADRNGHDDVPLTEPLVERRVSGSYFDDTYTIRRWGGGK